jgi:hypothetical protein
MDGSVKFQHYAPDERAKAAIMKLIRTYDNKVMSEQAFANWLINHLEALPLAKLKNSGNWDLYYNWNYGSKTIEQWYEVYYNELIRNYNTHKDYDSRLKAAKPLFQTDLTSDSQNDEQGGQYEQFDFEFATDDEIAEYYNRNSVSVNVAQASAQTARMKPSVKPNINWNTATPQQIEAYEEWMSENSDDVKAKPKAKPRPKPKPKPKAKKPKQPKISPEEQRLQTIIPVAFKSPLKKAELNLRGYTINNEEITPSVFPLK